MFRDQGQDSDNIKLVGKSPKWFAQWMQHWPGLKDPHWIAVKGTYPGYRLDSW